ILGSFFGGLVILPALQIQITLELMALLYAIPGLLLFAQSRAWRERKRLPAMAALIVPTVLVVIVVRPWDPLLMSGGLYLLRDQEMVKAAHELRLADALPDPSRLGTLLYSREGAEATVAVTVGSGENAQLSLRVGGKPDASSYGDMSTQISLTLVPEILHPTGPEEVLVIGLGSGVSAGCALAMDSVTRVDVAEMSPEVVEASRFFQRQNNLTYTNTSPVTLDTPKVQLVLNDARNHLLLTSRRYDVIASEPSNPWMAGVGNLFTKEAFTLARSRLKPGGIMCQWIHTYTLEADHVQSVVRTFGEVFPHMQLWQCNKGDLLLIGSDSELAMPLRQVQERLARPGVRAWLERVRLDTPVEFLAGYLADDPVLRLRSRKAPLHTDDNMLLEFDAPRSLYRVRRAFQSFSFISCPEAILDFSGVPAPERSAFLRDLDLAVSAREHLRLAGATVVDAHMRLAFALAPYQLKAVEHRNQMDHDEAGRLLDGTPAKAAPDPAAAVKLMSQAEARSGCIQWSRKALDVSRARDANARIDGGDPDGALAELDGIALPEHKAEATLLRARVFLARKDYDKALAQAVEAARLGASSSAGVSPAWSVECTKLGARILAAAGRKADALATLNGVLSRPGARLDPATAPLWHTRAELLLEQGQPDAALEAAQLAADLEPLVAAHSCIEGRVLTALGRHTAAAWALHRRAALEPDSFDAAAELAEAWLAAAVPQAEAAPTAGVAPAAASAPRPGPRLQPGVALEMLGAMRRVSRELTVLHSEAPRGFELLCRSFLNLERYDMRNAGFYKQEAEQTYQKLLALLKGDRSKLPRDLAAAFAQ
ncbi:MAG: hypothetical protein NTW87_19575, partial [Planctomycetota bacterium]|nr:hypothetical protein [Planctomycetota bacterium]